MKKILALFIFSSMIISCEKELDVKLIPKNPLLVMNCSIVADSTWLVSLTRTGNILDYTGTIPKVNDAEIIILNEKKEPIEKLEYFSS
ncbi:MAG TPA: hypothetical protein VFE57_11040, partial [Cyclobacteriaceae bacterium]|nr:hypothetical protein [Cyclobacteriaceae bacterium]